MQYGSSEKSEKLTTSANQSGDNFATLPAFIREKQLRKEFIQIGHATLWDWVAKQRFLPQQSSHLVLPPGSAAILSHGQTDHGRARR